MLTALYAKEGDGCQSIVLRNNECVVGCLRVPHRTVPNLSREVGSSSYQRISPSQGCLVVPRRSFWGLPRLPGGCLVASRARAGQEPMHKINRLQAPQNPLPGAASSPPTVPFGAVLLALTTLCSGFRPEASTATSRGVKQRRYPAQIMSRPLPRRFKTHWRVREIPPTPSLPLTYNKLCQPKTVAQLTGFCPARSSG